MSAEDHLKKLASLGYFGHPAGPRNLKSKKTQQEQARHKWERWLKDEADSSNKMGIDGEGIGRNKHRYVFLGAADRWAAQKFSVERESGLSTMECLDFILGLPKDAKLFAYAFNYDLTMMLRGLPDHLLYYLFRPDKRPLLNKDQPQMGKAPIKWGGYQLNLQGTKFTVSDGAHTKIIWDIFKFFQGPFVGAITDWKVGSPELWKRMAEMKTNRAEFDEVYRRDKESVWKYCIEECACMAELAAKLVDAHSDPRVGLKLTSFYGAGSSATAMLKKEEIAKYMAPAPEEMRVAVACAFFGGRFENRVIGLVPETLYSHDLSSAYPAMLLRLPCLAHGKWVLHKDNLEEHLESGKPMLVRYEMTSARKNVAWGPLPHRDANGCICYPSESGGGWCWGDEFLVAYWNWGNVWPEHIWVYEQACNCKPFANIPKYYMQRLVIGKDGPGIVIKLAMNSCYGKLAQSVGKAAFNSWIWAGMITSMTRAELLKAVVLHKDPSNLLMMATDGILTREKIDFPLPPDTGTYNAGEWKTKEFRKEIPEGWEPVKSDDGKLRGRKFTAKPLGGWEMKVIEGGVFFARPGIYFPLASIKLARDIQSGQASEETLGRDAGEEIAKIRARGMGRKIVYDNYEKIINSYNEFGISKKVEIADVPRFCGAKSSISRGGKNPNWVFKRADGKQKTAEGDKPNYGQWTMKKIEMSFDPLPKRAGVLPDGQSLAVRCKDLDDVSVPYEKALKREDDDFDEEFDEIAEEQPDGFVGGYSE